MLSQPCLAVPQLLTSKLACLRSLRPWTMEIGDRHGQDRAMPLVSALVWLCHGGHSRLRLLCSSMLEFVHSTSLTYPSGCERSRAGASNTPEARNCDSPKTHLRHAIASSTHSSHAPPPPQSSSLPATAIARLPPAQPRRRIESRLRHAAKRPLRQPSCRSQF